MKGDRQDKEWTGRQLQIERQIEGELRVRKTDRQKQTDKIRNKE